MDHFDRSESIADILHYVMITTISSYYSGILGLPIPSQLNRSAYIPHILAILKSVHKYLLLNTFGSVSLSNRSKANKRLRVYFKTFYFRRK